MQGADQPVKLLANQPFLAEVRLDDEPAGIGPLVKANLALILKVHCVWGGERRDDGQGASVSVGESRASVSRQQTADSKQQLRRRPPDRPQRATVGHSNAAPAQWQPLHCQCGRPPRQLPISLPHLTLPNTHRESLRGGGCSGPSPSRGRCRHSSRLPCPWRRQRRRQQPAERREGGCTNARGGAVTWHTARPTARTGVRRLAPGQQRRSSTHTHRGRASAASSLVAQTQRLPQTLRSCATGQWPPATTSPPSDTSQKCCVCLRPTSHGRHCRHLQCAVQHPAAAAAQGAPPG